MLSDKLILMLLLAATVAALPKPDDSDESKDDDDDCLLPAIIPESDRCRAFLSRWTFRNGACVQISYGGCGGTNNLFETEYACNSKCNRKALLRGPDTPARVATSPCQLPLANGHCRAHIPSFYFDLATASCKPFTFTGCKGNANNFISMEDCQRTCKVRLSVAVTLPAPIKDATKSVSDICSLPPDNSRSTGRACMAFVPSWTFNSTSGKCESYVYGGCGKTANLFRTEEACQTTCSSSARNRIQPAVRNQESCLLPVAKGPCFGFMKRYAFNMEKNRCELFTYGGCQGNGNNFATADQCFEACGGALPSLTSECEQVTCPISNKRYFERGCRPEYKGKACCPTSFSCSEDKSAKIVCHYGAITYQLGQQVPTVSEDQPCKTNCFCVSSVEHQDGATIKCSDMECPIIDPPAKGEDGCELITKPNTCCPSYHCHDHSSEENKEVDICLLNGQEYMKGQAIPTGDPCKTCTCVEGFTGLNGPGCRDTHCLIDNHVGCVPVYTDNVCCPTSYKCAKDTTVAAGNATRIIRVEGEPGKQSAVTLPFLIPGGNVRKWQVKAALCLLPKATGWCRASVPSFYYDADQLKCVPFIFGGCKGNENRFASEAECSSTCQHSDEETAVTNTPVEAKTIPEETNKGSSPFISSGATVTLPALVPGAWAKPKDSSVVSLRCSTPMRVGPCRMSLEKFYYDIEKGDCFLFFYGGCKGNSNQFDTVDECRLTCAGQTKTSAAIEQPDQDITRVAKQNVCALPQEAGPCKGQVPAFFYNADTGACKSFWYGGCRGNDNRFETESECQAQCIPATSTSASVTKASSVASTAVSSTASSETMAEHCKLPADIGPCRAAKPRYHYNTTASECQPFNFGGCRGNENNFHTIEQCQNECTAGGTVAQPLLSSMKMEIRARMEVREDEHTRCKLPADVGFCRAFQQRFYFDSIENQCKTFSWGGCRGNANNFESSEECVATCDRQARLTAAVSDPKKPAQFRVSQRFRASPVEAAVQTEADTKENEHVEIVMKRDQMVCTFGNETLNLGDRLQPEDPCEECICSTPPEITCTRQTCPPLPGMNTALCNELIIPGQCCPNVQCVSANPPVIGV